MVYKNLYNRVFLSFFFFFIYFIALNNKYYLFFFGTIIYLIILYEIYKFFKKDFIFVLFYFILSYSCFTYYFHNFFNHFIFNFFVFTIIFFDSFSFITGKMFGKYYIFKLISPKKTLEGYIGGIFFTNLFLISYLNFIDIEFSIIALIILINLTILISIIGDLIESFFKRKNNIKDSSTYLPGHGGFFDRFDSFLASIIMLTLYNWF